MKKKSLTLAISLLAVITFTSCNANKSKSIDNNAHQQASTQTRGFPSVQRPANDVNCRNCRATFKLSRASQKSSHGHNYIECPVCHHDYLKKAK